MTSPAIEVLRGHPNDDELAAIVVALGELARERRDASPPPVPAWRRAARLEGVGGRPVASAADLRGRG